MLALNLKPTHAPVKAYYEALHGYGQLHIDHEMAVRSAFQDLLSTCGRKLKLTLVPEFRIERARSSVIVDGALLDLYHLAHGYWEAKDERDDLDREVKTKLEKGYPRDNIIFQAPERAILYQSGTRIADEDISKPEYLAQIVNQFFDYKAAYIQEWEQAVDEFSERIPELAGAVFKIIEEERRKNPAFVKSFDDFYALCQQAINPNLSTEAVERMLVQHLLTERIFRKIFDNPDFTRRNVVAQEIEKVIAALTSRAFNRDEFLRGLDRFYKAIEVSAENTTGFSEKQAFLNKVYERFFQGFSPKEADTHGIVYTPQPIVNFMVRSVGEILKKEFGRSLSDKGVHILDPFVGTGNFVVRIMQEIKTTALPHKYENELHCNEVMLLPYYIASMNIEHAYFERTGEYKPFTGICLVDTFELAEPKQSELSFMTVENAERVKKQKQSPIFVITGNPPYNMGQLNENDNNQNRKYPAIDRQISETYARDSDATLKNKLSDPYVKAIRWATSRIGDEGIVAFVTNSSFLDQFAFDGMRKHLQQDFDSLYLIDLGGNVRKNPKLSGTTHNVFGIQVGVCISFLVRKLSDGGKRKARIRYVRAEELWRKEERYRFLDEAGTLTGMNWLELIPSEENNWLTSGEKSEFKSFLAITSKDERSKPEALFEVASLGVGTNRDAWVYSFNPESLRANLKKLISNYNSEVSRFASDSELSIRDLNQDPAFLKWTDRLKDALVQGTKLKLDVEEVRPSIYRPYTTQWLYFDHLLNQRRYLQYLFFPTSASANIAIWWKTGSEWPPFALMIDKIPDLLPQGGSQCFPFYTYAQDGTNRRENVTDWALEQFRTHYDSRSITKWDIFHYVYAVLHHPVYRERYEGNIRRELPRIPFVPCFHPMAEAGKQLMEIHVNYERQPEYELEQIEEPGKKLDMRVERMRLSKDKRTLVYNDFLSLKGIPSKVYEYRLGNRSALEWVIDQYQVSTDKRSGITNDPNRTDDPQYILRLIGQIITVSLKTVELVGALPDLGV